LLAADFYAKKALVLEPIPTKDIALAVLGGSAALASILLVFVGFMIMKAEGLPAEASNKIIRRYTLRAKLGLIPLAEQTIVIFSSYGWLFYPTSTCLFHMWSIGFVLGIILFVAYAVYVTFSI